MLHGDAVDPNDLGPIGATALSCSSALGLLPTIVVATPLTVCLGSVRIILKTLPPLRAD